MARWDEGIGEWSQPDMRDEGDLYDQNPPRITGWHIAGCIVASLVIYALIVTALVLYNGR
jgi:hypothetical protein